MSYIVTGGAGFIGSCIVRYLNDRGINDIIIVDNISTTEKWKNLVNKKYLFYINKKDFFSKLPEFEKDVTHVIHMGACSSTTEKDFDYLWENNVQFTKKLWEFCTRKKISFIYASSAATYGDGSNGFDDKDDISKLQPLNGYGYSKQIFDIWSKDQKETPLQHVGLKFFNVYGPNEYHKGTMASMVFHGFNQIEQNGSISLFNSYNPKFEDGKQLRDFVYVKDICKVIMWLLDNPKVNGLFNLGTGHADSFLNMAKYTFKALNIKENIKIIDMPEVLRGKYQYFTEAKMDKLYEAGYKEKFYTLEEGVNDYVNCFLKKGFEVF